MSEMHSKRLIQHDILEILKEYTDADHRLSQQQIQHYLEADYGISVDRKTVRRHLCALLEADEEHICFKEGVTRTRIGKKQPILSGWYYRALFTEGELRFLIDCVLFSDAMPQKYRRDLIRKLESLSNRHFHSIIQKIDMDVYNRLENVEFFLTIEEVENAIAEGKQVAFCYRDYGADGRYHLREKDGKPRRYTVDPYQFIRANGHSYLLCSLPGHEDLTHFRIDRIVQCERLDTPSRELRSLPAFKAGMRLSEYLTQHPNLWKGKLDRAVLRCPKYLMGDIVDAFGTKAQICEDADASMMQVRLLVDTEALYHWALQFADSVEVLKPKQVRERVAETLRVAVERYEN